MGESFYLGPEKQGYQAAVVYTPIESNSIEEVFGTRYQVLAIGISPELYFSPYEDI